MHTHKKETLLSDFYILIAAAVWGFAFVAQRASIEHIGAFYFNGIRFLLGAGALVPLYLFKQKEGEYVPFSKTIVPSIGIGILLYIAVNMQQVSLYFTTAGNAGFITGLYVVVVAVIQTISKKKFSKSVTIAALLSVSGLYFLSVTKGFTVNKGDLIVLVSTLFWAGHVLAIGLISGRHNPIAISIVQFILCGLLSMATGAFFEELSFTIVKSALLPILYGGLISVGIGYTLQVVGQKHSPPEHAAIIMSMEAVFAVIGAFFIIGETVTLRGLLGCILMFGGMVTAQIGKMVRREVV